MELTKRDLILIAVISLIFILVYSPHFQNPYPYHIDEWHNIEQALRIRQGEITYGVSGLEIGFRIFLFILSCFTDLVLIYKYLPALWAVISSLVLYYIARKKTNNFNENESFLIAIMAMIFFASLKSNVNLLGLWFFTPLTFSIPFIFLYIYFFTEGIENNDKKMMLYSFLLMLCVLFSHAPSLLFSIPLLLIFCVIKIKKIKKIYKSQLYFLLIPLIGILFYNAIMRHPLLSINYIPKELIFKFGWGVLEMDNSIFEIYSLVGWLMALLGIIFIICNKKIHDYTVFLLWFLLTLASVLVYKLSGLSPLAPYQRYFYYLGLSLPILSSFGLYFLTSLVKNYMKKISQNKILEQVITLMIIFIVIIFLFYSYSSVPDNAELYQLIDNDAYSSVKFLTNFPKDSAVIAPAEISTAVFPISGHNAVATIFFKGNSTVLREFFNKNNCSEKNEIIKKYNAGYVISKKPLECNWPIIYAEKNITIYQLKNMGLKPSVRKEDFFVVNDLARVFAKNFR